MTSKILIIPGGLQIGGAERVAANISLYAPPDKFEFHYLIFQGFENTYGPEIEKKGGKVFCAPSPSQEYRKYVRYLRNLMKTYQYSAIHSHTMFNSGINLLLARQQGIPVRIAHSHTTKPNNRGSVTHILYEHMMRHLIRYNGTHWFACGVDAGRWLYGGRFFDNKGIVIFNGIETQKNAFCPMLRHTLRAELNLENKFVIGHTGSLLPVKNQVFLIRIMPEIIKRRENAVLMLLGEGEQLDYLIRTALELGIQDHVVFYGSTQRVHELLNVFDVFAFPSLREGTPLSLLEAQANGLPIVVSDKVPHDAFLTNIVQIVSLEDKKGWVDRICSSERHDSKLYSARLDAAGYSAYAAYAPIYEAYGGFNSNGKGNR